MEISDQKLTGKKEDGMMVGTYVEPDGWSIGECLKVGLDGFCDFYLPTGYTFGVTQVAVNIKITGRTPIRRLGSYYRRVQITFLGDGEPNTVTGGWIPWEW